MDPARAALAVRDGIAPTFRVAGYAWTGPVRLPVDAAVALGHGDVGWLCRTLTVTTDDAGAVADRIGEAHLPAIVAAWGIDWDDFARTAWLIANRFDLLDAELDRYYGRRAVDLDARELVARVKRLPRFQADDPDWGYDQELAALVIDAVRSLEVTVVRLWTDQATGRKVKFVPVERPGDRERRLRAQERAAVSPKDRLLGIFRTLARG